MFKRLLNAGLRHEGGICHALGFQLVKHTTKETHINSHTQKNTEKRTQQKYTTTHSNKHRTNAVTKCTTIKNTKQNKSQNTEQNTHSMQTYITGRNEYAQLRMKSCDDDNDDHGDDE